MMKRLTRRSRDKQTLSSEFSAAKPTADHPHHKMRKRSVSEIVLTPPRYHGDHSLHYLGFSSVVDPRSSREIQGVIRNVCYTSLTKNAVSLSFQDGLLRIVESSSTDNLLLCPLHFVAQVTHDVSRARNDCLAISFATGHYANQCHVLQAKSSREAADVVQVLQKAYRSASKGVGKSRKPSDSVGGSAASVGGPGSGGFERVRQRVQHRMEDEDELVEHKSFSQYALRDKRIHSHTRSGEIPSSPLSPFTNRTSATSSDSTPSLHSSRSSRPHAITPSPKNTRRRKVGGHEGEFTMSERVSTLLSAVENILDNNRKLRDKCNSIVSPSNPFEDALYAMQTSNHDLLGKYLLQQVVSPDVCDSGGNSLLHYAVALGHMEPVILLCNSSASLESPGWNECRPIHRAAAEGNIPVLQALLRRGANVNGVDIMRRTPLHISSCKRQLMECSIALLEYGAQIMATDVIGVKPHDLSPELKETQNRLVTSACESFVTAQVKDPGPLLRVGSPLATPTSLSPASTRPSSIASARSTDMWMSSSAATTPTDASLDELLLEVHSRASAISRHYPGAPKKTKNLKHPLFSRSIGNLSELQESEEDEMHRRSRLEQLKFPSEYGINNSSYAVEEKAGVVVTRLNELIREGLSHKHRGVAYNRWLTEEERKRSMSSGDDLVSSEPNLHNSDSVRSVRTDEPLNVGERPFSSAAVLQGNRLHSPLVQHRLRADSLASHSSAGTLIRDVDLESEVSSSVQRVSRAFESLEKDLYGSKSQESVDQLVRLPDSLAERLRSPGQQLDVDSSPLMERRSKEETEAIFDAIITQLTTELEGLDSLSQGNTQSSEASLPSGQKAEEKQTNVGSTGDKPTCVVVGNTGDEHTKKKKSSKRSKSKQKEISSATLPTKKKGRDKWTSGMKRIGSPLFRSSRQKSFSGKEREGEVKGHTEKRLRRKMSLPEMNVLSTVSSGPMSQASSCDHMPQSNTSSSASFTALFSGRDPVANALKLMVTLSTNQECLGTLIAYICLPKCVTRLTHLAGSPHTPQEVINNVATLIQNLFEAGGPEGKKSALGSGLLDLTVKLLHSRDPIPGTCLSLLNSLLVSEDDNDYLRTIIRIPTKPLLLYLEPYEQSYGESDSGFENHRTSVSMTTRSNSDAQSVGDEGIGACLAVPPRVSVLGGKPPLRGGSFNSETSESSSGRSLYSPTLGGETVTYLEARRIVLKMLAVLSSHSKMQSELAKEGSLKLLVEACKDSSLENITNALISIANVAQNIKSHGLLLQLGIVEKLLQFLSKGPRPRYHAARALVYLGKLDRVRKISLFEPMATGYEMDVVIMSTDVDGHSFARGSTIEKCVEILTGDIGELWGGFSLSVGPPAEMAPQATRDQILHFFLTTYQSFVKPLILMRLLLHRLGTTGPQNPFDWSVDSVVTTTSHTATVHPTQSSVLKLIGQWMETYPDDFIEHPSLQQEVLRIIQRLKAARGPYLPHAHRLKSFLQDTAHPRMSSSLASVEEGRVPHHDNLYKLCKQMVLGGHLPVTMEMAVFLASLQLHIENLVPPPYASSDSHGSAAMKKRSFTGRLKLALPVGSAKSKQIVKRVRNQMIELDGLSDRNSKHRYIEECQSHPGYDCTFFSVRVPSSSRFRRGPVSKQLLGISTKRVVFLEEKTRELVASHSLQSVLSINRESDPCSLVMILKGNISGLKVVVDSAAIAREVNNVLEQCKGEGVNEETNLRWSESIPSLFTVPVEQGELAESPDSTPSTGNSPASEGLSPGPVLNIDHAVTDHVDSGHKLDTLRAVSQGDSLVSDLADNVVSQREERPLFCDCPPDPELPRELNLKYLSLTAVLGCPLEVARQMTIIAHDHFCHLTSMELLQKVGVIPKQRQQRDSAHCSTPSLSLSLSDMEQQQETGIEKLAYRFNQVGNWVANSILQFDVLEERVEVVQQFITIAKHCLDLRNYSSVMAIIVAGLGSAPIRRLHHTWAGVQKTQRELFKQMDTILDSRGNYKHYRHKLSITVTPAVPYVGVFLKDLTFICDGNPDYLRGGLINLHKRRQVYKKLEEIRHFQQEVYKLHKVPELCQYLKSHRPVPEDDLHSLSHAVEPRMSRSLSAGGNFFKKIGSSSSASNLHRTVVH